MILGHAGIPGNGIAYKKAKETSRRQDLFPYNNYAIHVKWSTEWNDKDDKLKDIEPHTRLLKEHDRCRKDETVISRLRAGHTLLTNGYLMEGLPVLECEQCHNHAMTVKHLLILCANLVSLRLRFIDAETNPWKK